MALDYPYLNLSDILVSSSAACTDTTSISSSNIVSSSLFVADGLDAPLPLHLSGGAWSGYSAPPPATNSVYTSPPPHLQLCTPDSSPGTLYYPPLPACDVPPSSSSQLHVLAPATSLPPVRDIFFCGSSLEESPISSPGDLEREGSVSTTATANIYHQGMTEQAKLGFGRSSSSPLAHLGLTGAGDDDSFCHPPTKQVPDGIKMPQRKGGMQLWQFLYSMLNNKDGKYRNLIEWTHTAKERQFRLLEPDAIAVWWGHHKNKPNMSYDKLSRSLRYYYDKGIIRKISGERFVYRFCIDPEIMYKHMGTSNSRPQLKPMPQDAKVALNSKDHSLTGASPCIAQEPEALSLGSGNSVEHIPASYPLFPSSTFQTSLPLPVSTSFTLPSVGPEMRRCHSYDSTCRSSTISPSQTPSPAGYDTFPPLYTDTVHFTSSYSPRTCSPPQSASLEEYPCVPLVDPHSPPLTDFFSIPTVPHLPCSTLFPNGF